MTNQYEIDKKRESLQAQLAELTRQEAELKKLTPEMRLAEALHDLLCKQNHTDMCDWGYDSWPSTRGQHSARGSYLRRAEKTMKLLPDFTIEEIINVAAAIKGL